MSSIRMLRQKGLWRAIGATGLLFVISGCEDGAKFNMFQKKQDVEQASSAAERPSTTRLVERDIEAPEVFQKVETALWGGTPSFGGVWVAHPDVTEPERVIIRNEENGKFVIGSLFKRERENPGPRIQVSSDAASALGILAGQPTKLNVTALRREEAPDVEEQIATADTLEAPAEIESRPLEPLAAAAAAIDAAETAPKTSANGVIVAAAPLKTEIAAPQPKPVKTAAIAPQKTGKLDKPFVQIGIFSVESNASGTSDRLRKQGIVPTVLAQESRGKKFWRVIVGPTSSASDRAALLKKVKAAGFTDAYFVTD